MAGLLPCALAWLGLLAGTSSLPRPRTGEVPAFTSVYLVFAEEHSEDFISGFGHLYVCLTDLQPRGAHDLLGATAVNFGADTSPLGRGPWIGQYKLQKGHELARKNTKFDQRRIWFFELSIDADHTERLRKSLQERLEKEYPYDFLRHNCANYIRAWLLEDANNSVPELYLTPRQALSDILRELPPASMRLLRPDLETLETHLIGRSTQEYRAVRNALKKPELLWDIEDPHTRLLALRAAESRATGKGHRTIQEIRSSTLETESGLRAARTIAENESRASAELLESWPEPAEGPAASLATVHRSDWEQLAARITLEAGLRDHFTVPVPQKVMREVSFLRLTADIAQDEQEFDLILASISTYRNAFSLRGGLSSGFSAGYRELPSPLNNRGMSISAWAGPSIRSAAGWFGARVSLSGDDLATDPSLTPSIGATWTSQLGDFVLEAELHGVLEDGLGGALRARRLLGDSWSVTAEGIQSPDDRSVLGLSVQVRI